jgi:hypothetical protein
MFDSKLAETVRLHNDCPTCRCAPVQPPTDTARGTCPRCGAPLILRTNKSDGRKFFGCSRYRETRCNYTHSLPGGRQQ